jgi:hypothetical protein
VKNLQYNAIMHASSPEINTHAFVLMGCGTGKSGIYNLLLLGALFTNKYLKQNLYSLTVLLKQRVHQQAFISAGFR